MRIAILSAGLVHRSLPATAASIKKYLLRPLQRRAQVDVFFHSWGLQTISHSRTGESGHALNPGAVAEYLPEARGYFSSQEEFLETFGFETFYANLHGSMVESHFPEMQQKELTKAMICFLRSLKHAYQYASEHAELDKYDAIIFARCDVRYLHRFSFAYPEKGSVYVPAFHSWLGCNDRFAYGRPRAMEIYCNRFDFLSEWVARADHVGSEKMLMEWLLQNNVRIEKIPFFFQRVRANGKVADLDKKFVWSKARNLYTPLVVCRERCFRRSAAASRAAC